MKDVFPRLLRAMVCPAWAYHAATK